MKSILSHLLAGFKKINGGFIIISVLVFVLGWQIGHRDYQLQIKNYQPKFTVSNQTPDDKNVNLDFKLFWDTWNLVSQKYIDKKAIDPQKLYYGAIVGMVAAIGDPYTVFLPPQAQQTSKEQLGGSFEGVGIQLEYNKDKRLVVVAPLKDTPAEKAGIKSGDLILGINGKDTSGLSLPEAVGMIKGPKGTAVTLALLSSSDSKPHDIQVTRDTIVVKSVTFLAKTTKSNKSIAYIRVASFGEKTKTEWNEAVSESLSVAPQGVIVDLRNDPGGYLDASVYLASEFLKDQTVVMQEDAQGNRITLPTDREGKMLKLPLVVLINKGSASASEIFSGAIQDYKRGTLVGEQSFGKGTIQSAEELPQGTGLHITTAKWLTPDGRWIHNIGLTPDVKVDQGDDPLQDPPLTKALEILDTK